MRRYSMRFDGKTVELAKQLVEQKCVLNAVKYKSSKVWFAEVLDGMQLYDVYLDTENIQGDSCQCHHFQQYHFCKHTIAVELYLHVKGYQFKRKKENADEGLQALSLSQLLYQKVKQLYYRKVTGELTVESHPTLQLEVTLHCPSHQHSPSFYLSFRLEHGKYYLIKDCAAFLEAYQLGKTFKIGSTRQIEWSIETFDKSTHDFLQFLFYLKQNHPTAFKGRQICLPSYTVKDCLNHLSRLLQVKIEKDNRTLNYLIHPQKLHFKIEQSEVGFLVRWLDQSVELYLSEKLALVDEMLYGLNDEEMASYQLLVDLFALSDNKTLTIPTIDKNNFLCDTLPFLQRVAIINKEFLSTVSFETPQVTFTVQFVDKSLMIDTHFHYSDAPLLSKNRILEHRVEHQLKRLGFFNGQKVFDNLSDLYAFVFHKLPILEKLGKVNLPEHWQDKFMDNVVEPYITLQPQGNLLDITFQIDGISQEDIDHILKHLQEKESVYEFSDGRVLDLEIEQFTKIHHILEKVRGKVKFKNGSIQVNRTQALQFAGDVQNIDDTLQQLINDLKYPEQFSVALPKGLQTTLKPYQFFGYQWLKMLSYHQLGGILADDMGLGKTIQSIAYLLSEFECGHLKEHKALVIAPASLIFNWKYECAQFAPSLSLCIMHGSRQEREQLLTQCEQSNVIITSYQSFRQDSDFYQSQKWHVVILDESQMVKNHTTKIHRDLREITTSFMFALSGTPIENRKEEFWAIYALLLPGLFPPLRTYRALSEGEIARIAQPFLLRRLKRDVLNELPDKLEHVMYSELTKDQKILYMGYLQRMQDQVKAYSIEDMNKNRFDILSGLMRLKQICCHPSLFVEQYAGDVGKLNQFIDLMDTCMKANRRVLVFSQFASLLPILEHALAEKGYDSFQLTGQTPVKERLNIVQAFNRGEKAIFLMSLKAGGTGLNLTSADTIVLYDLWWNSAVEEQAMSRAHRIGQKQTVQVYRMVAEGTIEEKIMQLQQRKRDLFEAVVTHEADGVFHRHALTNEDLKEILGIPNS